MSCAVFALKLIRALSFECETRTGTHQDVLYQSRGGKLSQPELTAQPGSYWQESPFSPGAEPQGSGAGLQGLALGCTALTPCHFHRGKPEKALGLGITMLH